MSVSLDIYIAASQLASLVVTYFPPWISSSVGGEEIFNTWGPGFDFSEIAKYATSGGSGVATGGLDGALHRGLQARGPSEPDQHTINLTIENCYLTQCRLIMIN